MTLRGLRNSPSWRWPEDAGEELASVLGDRSAPGDERLLAAELAGEYVAMDETLAATLLDVLRAADEPAELRGQVAIAFGPTLEVTDEPQLEGWEDLEERPVSEETADEILEALASGDRRIRREAVRSAGRASLHAAWPRVRRIVRKRGPGRDLFLAAIRAAGTVGPSPQVVWEELHGLRNAEDEEVAHAADEAISTAELFGGDASSGDG